MSHCHSEDFSAIHQSPYIMNISNDRKTSLEFFSLIWRGNLINIMIFFEQSDQELNNVATGT